MADGLQVAGDRVLQPVGSRGVCLGLHTDSTRAQLSVEYMSCGQCPVLSCGTRRVSPVNGRVRQWRMQMVADPG
jgi:hypothetical protein